MTCDGSGDGTEDLILRRPLWAWIKKRVLCLLSSDEKLKVDKKVLLALILLVFLQGHMMMLLQMASLLQKLVNNVYNVILLQQPEWRSHPAVMFVVANLVVLGILMLSVDTNIREAGINSVICSSSSEDDDQDAAVANQAMNGPLLGNSGHQGASSTTSTMHVSMRADHQNGEGIEWGGGITDPDDVINRRCEDFIRRTFEKIRREAEEL